MEKIIYALWREGGSDRADFNNRLREALPDQLGADVHALRVNLQDEDSLGGSAPAYASTNPPIEAFVQLWVDTALDYRRRAIDEEIAKIAPCFSAWLVAESAPLIRDYSEWEAGERTPLYNHIAVISVPPRLSWGAWQDRWQNSHTQVAIETQSNVEYLQNLIVRPLTYAAPRYAAIIEESFPSEAKFDDAVFHDAQGDPARHEANKTQLLDSTFSFVDGDKFDLIPTSQFDYRVLGR